MEKFIHDLASPYWWLSIVIVGLFLNIFSNVLFKKYEQYKSQHSDKKRRELQNRQTAREQKVNQLIGKKDDQIIHHLNISNYKQSALEYFLLGTIIINIPFIIPLDYLIVVRDYEGFFFQITHLIFNLLFGFFAYYYIWKGLRLRRQANYEFDILKEAIEKT